MDFIKAFVLGFDVDDAVALLRVEDLFVDSFDISDGNISLLREQFLTKFHS